MRDGSTMPLESMSVKTAAGQRIPHDQPLVPDTVAWCFQMNDTPLGRSAEGLRLKRPALSVRIKYSSKAYACRTPRDGDTIPLGQNPSDGRVIIGCGSIRTNRGPCRAAQTDATGSTNSRLFRSAGPPSRHAGAGRPPATSHFSTGAHSDTPASWYRPESTCARSVRAACLTHPAVARRNG
jgi:hypothetical protein